jgi:hypothetical protein
LTVLARINLSFLNLSESNEKSTLFIFIIMQALSDLPIHSLPMVKPSPSKTITGETGKHWYSWELTESERSHITNMLECKG